MQSFRAKIIPCNCSGWFPRAKLTRIQAEVTLYPNHDITAGCIPRRSKHFVMSPFDTRHAHLAMMPTCCLNIDITQLRQWVLGPELTSTRAARFRDLNRSYTDYTPIQLNRQVIDQLFNSTETSILPSHHGWQHEPRKFCQPSQRGTSIMIRMNKVWALSGHFPHCCDFFCHSFSCPRQYANSLW